MQSPCQSYENSAGEAPSPTFVDIFTGCGALSLGLMRAGWQGLFAIEKDAFAFETLSANLLGEQARYRFSWPDWLAKAPICISDFIESHEADLSRLKGKVDLVVGGPPCQGFSSAGRRDPNDPRNRLVSDYLEIVHLLQPKVVLIENVRGFTMDFADSNDPSSQVNFAAKLQNALSKRYKVFSKMLNFSNFGVPQGRSRFFIIAIRENVGIPTDTIDPFDVIESGRAAFLRGKGLTTQTTSWSAISDLEVGRNGCRPSCENQGFEEICYLAPRSRFQTLMRDGAEAAPPDTRLARHSPEIIQRFQEIIELCHADGRLNISLGREGRERFGLKKRALRVLDPDRPSPTVTSMPDDLLHYCEPRTLTVRENARLQGFPDWFTFKGKYTTGGHRRRSEVPRFTQVANAVPPLVAEAIGISLLPYIMR